MKSVLADLKPMSCPLYHWVSLDKQSESSGKMSDLSIWAERLGPRKLLWLLRMKEADPVMRVMVRK